MRYAFLLLMTIFLSSLSIAQNEVQAESDTSESSKIPVAPSGLDNYNRIKSEYALLGIWEISTPYRERNGLGYYPMEVYTVNSDSLISFMANGEYRASIIKKKENKYLFVTDKWGTYFELDHKGELTLYGKEGIDLSTEGYKVRKKQYSRSHFDIERDLLLAHYDCKTDVDDLQSVAALATLLTNEKYSGINYHAVAGAYGIQEGLYVPPNELFDIAFGDNWTDAHENFESAVAEVEKIALSTLANQGDIWIADAGQSDFSAALIKAIRADTPVIDISQRIHVVQHSDWNEKVTSPSSLDFVKTNIDYQKIPDGNAEGNGTPGFRSPDYTMWQEKISDPALIEIWQLAIDLSNKYNGKEGRYLNEAISAGGLDFSDLSEICWILGLHEIKDTEEFFALFQD